ncbi:MAG: hypothetical protein NUV94_07515 [Candidatus Acetothermia bacterium]|nr:hypothetical protein [Candidatus Acetothermia bacterium]
MVGTAALALGALFAFPFRSLIAGLVVAPLIRLWWLVDAVPQGLVWVVLVGGVAVLVARMLMPGAGRRRPPGRAPAPSSRPSQLAELVQLIRRADASPWARRRLAARLSRTAVALRARRAGIPPGQAWQEIRADRWPARPELRAALHPEDAWRTRFPHRGWRHVLARAVDALWGYAKGGDVDR